MKIDPFLSPCTKLKSKWIKDISIKPNTLNFMEENVGSTLQCIGTKPLLNVTPVAQTLREKIDKWKFLKLKFFCKAKDMVNKTKQQPTIMGKDLHQPHMIQRTDLQNKQRILETGHQKNEISNKIIRYKPKERTLNREI